MQSLTSNDACVLCAECAVLYMRVRPAMVTLAKAAERLRERVWRAAGGYLHRCLGLGTCWMRSMTMREGIMVKDHAQRIRCLF